jgi:hypothetical protein
MGRQNWLAAKLHAIGLGICTPARRAFHDAAAFKLGGNAEHSARLHRSSSLGTLQGTLAASS